MATQTAPPPEQSQAMTTVEKSPLFQNFADQYQMTAGAMVTTLMQTVFPHGERDPKPTWSQLAMFMSVANQYRLNPFTRQIYAFPDKNGGVVPIVPIDGWVSLIQREKAHDGMDFQYHWEDGSTTDGAVPPRVGGKLVRIASITCIIYRKDQSHPTKVTETLSECFRATKPWETMEIRMLRHKALMQGGRYAYGLGGIYDEDEARDIIQGGDLPIVPDSVAQAMASGTRTDAVRAILTEKKASNPTEKPQGATEQLQAAVDATPEVAPDQPAAEPEPVSQPANQDTIRVDAKVTDVELRKNGKKEYVLATFNWMEGDFPIECPVCVWHRTLHDVMLGSLGKTVDVTIKRNVKESGTPNEVTFYSLEILHSVDGEPFIPPTKEKQ